LTELSDAGGPGIQERYPLTPLQHGMLLQTLLEPSLGVNVLQAVCRFREPLDADRLERACRRVVARHDVLRTRFRWNDVPEPVQEVVAGVPVEIARHDGAGAAPAEREEALARYLAEDRARGFDLAEAPAMRLALFHGAGDDERVLVWSVHHVLLDAWSLTRVLGEVLALYDAGADGAEAALPVLRPFREHVRWLRERDPAADEAYWTGVFEGLEAPDPVPPIRSAPRDPRAEPRFSEREIRLAPAADDALRALKRDHGVFVNTVVQGAWALLLGRYTGRPEVVFGTVRSARAGGVEGADGMVGMFLNTVPIRVPLPPEARVVDWLREIGARSAGLAAHQHAALTDIQRWSGFPQGAPLFDTFVNYQPRPFDAPFRGVEGRSARVLGRSGYPLTLSVDAEAPLSASIRYDADLFDAAAVDRILGHFARLLEEMAADPERPLGALSLLGEAERALVLEEWSRSEAEYPTQPCIHELVEAQAARTPGAVAVVFEGAELTYAELNARANRLAHHLRALGVGPDARVAIAVERGPEMVVGLLSILKAGGAYVPLDPAYPADRLRYMLGDSSPAALLVQSSLAASFASVDVPTVVLDAEDAAWAVEPETNPDRAELRPGHLAYVIYTSGSTGRPKGVLVEHGGLVSHTVWQTGAFGIGADDTVLQRTSISFDASVWELWTTLAAGARMLLLPPAAEKDPGAIGRAIGEGGVTIAQFVPTLLQAVLGALPEGGALPCRIVFCGGEPLPASLVEEALAAGAGEVVNLYGPTEATIQSTAHACGRIGDGRACSIGRPIANARVYILDARGEPVPVGVAGELYAGGAGVARGYLGRPGLTAERFVADPFSGEAGARMYRTGDLGRWNADGTIEFRGRLDAQVKIRGFRIEPGEIEARLAEHPEVREAIVLAREDAPGDRRLVAYVVGGVEPDALRAHLRQSLPEYMVPGAFVSLDHLPLTPNGKVDRKALPAPDLASAETYVAPRTPVEEVLAEIWAEVLRIERVGVQESFFALGGHSLLTTRVAARIRAVFGVELPPRVLFESTTVAELAGRVEEMRRADLPVLPPVVPVERTDALPLSFAQERLWFLDRLEPGSTTYNLPVAWRLAGVLDGAALERALGEAVRRHEALRTVFAEVDGSPVQVIAPFGGFTLPVEDLSNEADREAAVRRRVGEEARRAFDLAAGPLFRAALLRVDEEDHVLLLSMHHIVSDGWSMGVLFRELSALYAAYLAGGESPLPELAVQYADYAVWQREHLAGEVLDRQLSYWTERLAGAPELLELPTDRPRSPVRRYQGAAVPVSFSPELLERLQTLGRNEGATLYMTLLGAFQVLLSKYGGGEDVVVGSPIAGRTRGEVEELIGFFVNTLVLRTDLSGDPGFRDVLRRVREVTLGAYEHQEVPFEKLVAELRPERSLSHSPLFQVMFTLQNAGGEGGALPGLSVSAAGADLEGAKFDLSLSLAATASGLRGRLAYSTDLFEPDTIERMVGHLERLLEQVAADADARLSRLELLGEAERALVLEEWNRTGAEYPTDRCIHELVEAQAARTPGAVAVVFEGAELTYAELNARANRLAHHLRALGVGPDARVGLCLERGVDAIVGLLGALKAGGAYVPLDPSYPVERLREMLSDSRPVVLLTQTSLRERVGSLGVPAVALDADAGAWAERPETNPTRLGLTPEHLAYVIYTSGSTGRPKGVMVRHGSVVNLAWALHARIYAEHPSPLRVGVNAPLVFDGSVKQIIQLAGGHALCLVPEAVRRDPAALVAWLADERVDVLDVTPSLLRLALAEELGRDGSPRLVLVGGEAVDEELRERMSAVSTRFHNVYGPTECTVDVTTREIGGAGPAADIGGPLPNVATYVLDPALQPVPIGIPGELYVGGAGLARGYLGRPGITAKRFVPDPFGGTPGARLYRTGDRVRWMADGTLEYLGRLDVQVKIRGFRIELGEIELRLAEHPEVREAVVVAREDQPGDRRLVAYVVGGVDTGELRAHLRRSLPEYMVPAAFVVLEALPLTPNGKLDRKALPAPEYETDAERYVAPRAPVEEVLAGILAEVLRLERVGVEESFFELGGHSLMATRVVSRIRAVFGVELPLRALFEGPTVGEMAARVEEIRRADLPVLPPVVPVERTGALPLSFAQERLWFIDQLEPGSAVYNLPMAWRLGGALDGAALERALAEIVRRHESLRTVFTEVDGSPEQVVAPFGGFALPVEDLSGSGEADREAAVRRRAGEEARRPFDLAAGPLFRAVLLRVDAEDHVLLLSMHHIVSDGWSMGVLFRELSALYAAYHDGEESPLAEPVVQYADYAVWQREQLADDVLDRQLSYWKEQLAGAPELLELPTDHPRPPLRTHQGATVPVSFSPELLERLQALGRSEGATLYMTLLGAFKLLLSKYGGGEDIVVGSPIAGRTRREVEEVIGFFVNTLVLRTDLSGDPGFREVLGRVREMTLGAYEHQDVPFEKLVAELQPERSLSHSPLFQVMFTLQNADDRGTGGAPAGLKVGGAGADLEGAKFDLSLFLTATSRGLQGGLTYGTDLFERDTIERMVGHLERVLEQVAADPDAPLSRLELPGDAERALVLEEWNRTEAGVPADRCIHQLFEEQAARAPGAVAVVFQGAELTYAGLDARANQLAHRLRALGVRPDARVGVLLERSAELIVALLAVLKAGGAYVPLDPAYPAERLEMMLADSGAAVLLTREALRALLPPRAGVEVVSLDAAAAEIATESAGRIESGATARTLAYVIYTSGSTGTPKGVAVEHGGLASLCAWHARAFAVTPADRATQLASPGFDAAGWEVWPYLASGACVDVVPDEVRADPEGLRNWLVGRSISIAFVPTPVAEPMLALEWPRETSLRWLLVGGDRLRARPAADLPFFLSNNYGPTECTVVATSGGVEAGGARTPSIGGPIAHTRAYVLDAGGRPLPVGVPGELYVGGVQVARGYLNRPRLTAQRFVPDPFGGEAGARLYRTGDRVRWLNDGTLEFLGRLDEQVKIRGFRIELGEIEVRLAEHPEVREAVVLAREDRPGDRRLVAYVMADHPDAVDVAALRAHVRQSVPEYMVPAAFVVLEALPLTPNGKLDRRALPAPDFASAEERYTAPRTPAEEVLAGIWAEVLRLERVGVEENFFELGGHSLLATRVVSRIRAVFGVELPLRALFEGPTTAELAARVEEMRRADLPALPPVVPAERTGALPLSFAQERLWFLDRLEPGSSTYNIPMAWRLGGALDGAALERALAEIVRRHESLRTVFAEVDGSPVQVVAPFGGFTLPVEELSGSSEADREAAVRRRAGEEARRAFDLAAGPLFRAVLLRVDAEDHVLLLSMHHVVSDGWSMGVLFRELSALYAAYHDGEESPLAEPVVQYADYAVWQREQLAGEVLDRQLAYWKEQLAGAPELLELPTDRPRPPVRTYQGATVPVSFSPELLERLQALGRSEGATLYMTLLGAFQVLLSKYGGGEDIVVGSPIAGRTRREVEELIGFFVNTLVLRTDLSGDPSFREVLGRVRETTLGAYEHQDVPFEKLVAELQPERSLSHSPLFQVLFALQNAEGRGGALPGLSVSGAGADLEGAKFDLSLVLTATPQGLRGGLTYGTDLFERDTIERMVGHLERVLEQVAADADVRLSRLELLGEAERSTVVEEWNRTEGEYPADRCIHQLIEEQAARTPGAVAVRFEDESLTYGELNVRANRLAHSLRRRGVGPEVRVGICLERSLEMVVSILAVLKAGGAYVPLDPGYPADRLAFILADSATPVLLTEEKLRGRLPARAGTEVLTVDGALAQSECAGNPESGVTPDTLAYVIYTSGSTGRPKGVMNAHRGVVNRLWWMQSQFRLDGRDVVLQKTPFSFDVSVWEFFWPLQHGACLVMARPEGHRDPAYLREVIERRQVTTLHFVPSMLQQFMESAAVGQCASLERVICSGEALSPALVEQFHERFPSRVELHNLYGPTEAAVDVSWWACERRDSVDVVPIGRPILNTRLYVLDAGLQPVPVGAPGELYIGGVQVARGYLNRPSLTASRFVPDHLGSGAGTRLYATGDRARWRVDGAIEYLGRLDDQVKIRGFRIEPGEIEAALCRHDGVRDSVVVVREDQPGDRRLVAYVVADHPDAMDVTALRAHVRQSLPEYMVPAAFMSLEALPLTPNGKLDRKALPAPELGSAEETYVAPRTPAEEVLAGIWAEVLRIERVGVEESFFELGGHSLLATRVVSRIRAVFGVELPLRALFEGPTVGEMAVRVEEMRRAELPVLPPVVPVERTGALPLSFAQERLWFIDQLEPGSTAYNIPVAWRLGGALDEAALERALGEIVRRHESLRTVFGEVGDAPVQVVAPFGGFVLPVEDLSGLSDSDRELAVRRRAGEEARRAFDLAAGPLFRAALLRLGEEEHVLLLGMHHIVSDGWSMEVLFRELSTLYEAYREGRESPLPELAVQYADYAVWQREQLEGEVLDRQLAYWRERLAGAPELLELPTDRPRPAVQTYRGAHEQIALSGELLERLHALGRSEGTTLYMTLLGAFQVLLSRYSGSEDIVVGSPIAGRTRGELEALIGFFVNTLVLRTDLVGDPSFREVLGRVRGATLGAYENQEVPFERLVEELQPERSLSHSPLFQVLFTLQNAGDGGSALPGLRVSRVGAELGSAKFDLSLSFAVDSRGLQAVLAYRTDLFEPGTIKRMLSHLERVLEQVAADADVRLSRLELLSAEERSLVVDAWNQTEAEYPADRCLHELFEAQAARTPGAVAVVHETEALSYAELNARANRIAHHLVALGVGAEVRVGIGLERGPHMLASMLGVLKAGGAYVPLDPAYPADRLAFTLKDSSVQVLVTQETLRERFPVAAGVRVVSIDGDAGKIAGRDTANPAGRADARNLAYLIYTSGSTGIPKGVAIQHESAVVLLAWAAGVYTAEEMSGVLAATSISFDLSIYELFLPLSLGGRAIVVENALALPNAPARDQVRLINTVPSAIAALLKNDAVPAGVRTVNLAGEPLRAELVDALYGRGTVERVYDLYGPSEDTTYSTYTLRAAGGPETIGRPIANTQAYVLDAAMRPVPVGIAGELYLGGRGLARGYLGRPALTAEKFIPDPFADRTGGRLYRTGDKARWKADGTLEYLGRLDAQVKVRGYRIELGEIESVLRGHSAVTDCVVVVREDAPGDRRIAAYVVGAADADALRQHLRRSVPEYMVPGAIVMLDALPLTPNGKVDRKALPAPGTGQAGDRYVAPRTPVEEVLGEIWAEVLRVERVGVEESFFELGGHSLLATRVVSRIRAVFGVELPLRALFEGPTVGEMAVRVEEMRRAELPVLPPVVPVDRTGSLPLSFAQERLWFLDRLEPGSSTYNIPMAWRLGGALDGAALERALAEIVRRHESLRTVFAEVDGSPVQVVAPFGGFTLPVEELSGSSEADREAAVRRRAGEEARRAFDLAAGPLFRAVLLRVDAEDHVLLLSMHHVVSDGWSMGVLFRELSALYAAYHDGEESPLAEPVVQYADYAVWQREQLAGEVLDRQLAYWKEQLAGAPELLELPTDRPRPPVRTYQGATVPVSFSPELLERLQALGRSEGATLYMTLLGAFQVLLSKYGGGEDIVVGSPIAGRTRREVEELIGFFVNTLVLRTDLSGDPSFREVLGRVRETTLGAYEHQDVPFEKLVAELQPERSLSHSPLFQVLFALQNAEGRGGALPGLSVSGAGADLEGAKFDLSLVLTATPQGLRGGLTYGTDLFERDTIERMVGHLERVLEQVAADADVRLSRLELLGEAERSTVVEEWNRTEGEYPADRCIHQLIEEQAARTPGAVAVRFEDESLTYGELNVRANRLAHSLRRRGVGPEVRVGICLERSLEMVVSILAVLKAGGAYVPLDPGYPADRLAFILADSATPVLLTEEKLRGRLPARAGTEVLTVDGALAQSECAGNPESGVTPDTLAYVIYTSGSTGRPKGVMNAHRGVVNRLWWMQSQFRLDGRDVVLQKTPFSFDVSVWEFFWPLQHGACLVMARPEGHRDPAYLREVIEQRQVTTLHFVPSMLQQFVESAAVGQCASLERVVCSGEALSPALVEQFHERFPSRVELHNLYGPTEAAVDVSWWACERREFVDVVPIGRPILNTRLYVLDAGLQPVPVGAPGELYIGGVQVARGYLNRPSLTASRFVPDHLGSGAGSRLYATGDRARWRADGAIEYLGRLDDQVKIRGFRIEPGEIEAALCRHDGVRDSVVVVREDQPGDRRLVAYVVGAVEADALRAHLRQSLPEHMVPGAFVSLGSLPLTPNGKLDRKALPAPELTSAEGTYVAPRTPAEEVLAGIWAEVLRLERVGVHDNFFELSGHSLLATRVVSRIRAVFGVELPLRALFEGPTVGEMAVRVEEMRRAELPALPPVVPTERTGALPLSFAQERLWFLDRLEPGSAFYNVPAALRLRGALKAGALERALGEIVRRHEALRTTFTEVDGLPVQVIAPFGGFTLPVEELSGLSEADRELAVGRRAGEEAGRAFDLAQGPLFRATLLRLEEEDHVLLLSMHHVVSDGWSMGVLFRELSALYAAYREGGESPLAELAVQYADYSVWQREQLAGEVLDLQLSYWRERLAGAPELLELPTDRPRPAVQTYRGATVSVELSSIELLERLRALGRSEGATLYMVLLGAFQVLLSRYSGSEDVVVGSPIAGRMRREVEELIGFFVNTLVLRTDLGGDPSFREVLRRVRETALGAYAHQELPFERLVAELQPERSLSHSPLFQVLFTLQNAGDASADLVGVRTERVESVVSTTQFDLHLAFGEGPRGLRAVVKYSTDLFERSTIVRMLGHVEQVLEEVSGNAELRLSQLRVMGAAERRRVLEEWNGTAADYPADLCSHELFEAQVERTPDAVAAVYEGEPLSYGELNARANRLAHHLRSLGVGPDARVAICVERGLEMLVGMMAILKAGGAYVPLDPAYPADRLRFMLEDSAPQVLLTHGVPAELFAGIPVPVVGVAAEATSWASRPSSNPCRAGLTPDHLCYVIYTSGSTGRPKGVAMPHRPLVNLVAWQEPEPGRPRAAVTLQFTTISFDVSFQEIFTTLATGGRLEVASEDARHDPSAILDLVEQGAVERLSLPFSMLQLVAEEAVERGAIPSSLREVQTAGEALRITDPIRKWFGALGIPLHNHYGPSETHVATSFSLHGAAEGWPLLPSIGSPVANTRVYVLDAHLAPVPEGVPGELYLAGVCVARGYLDRPGPTAERFMADPFASGSGARMYRTGDRVRWLPDGTLDFLGRVDHQVKIRGFRIEPGEIEAVLRRHPAVAECTVFVREDEPGEKRLVAYVVGEAETDALREHLRGSLPDYMVPGAFVRLESLPLTPNGKLDRKALPAPEHEADAERYVAPRTPTEEVLAGIWAEVLRLERVGVHDNFFDLGGHSLLATRMVSRIRAVLSVELPLRALFEAPAVAELSVRVEEMRRAEVPLLPPVVRRSPASDPYDSISTLDELSDDELDLLLSTQF
jgi:amino acid adenylation domain-containing protein